MLTATVQVTDAKPQYSGITYLTSSISKSSPHHPTIAALVGQGGYMAVGSNKTIAAQCMTSGEYTINVGLRLPENWSQQPSNAALVADAARLRQHFLDKEFSDWISSITDIVRHTDSPFRAWPLYAMPVESLSWQTVPGVALLGDAAHVSTPFEGEGVNQSLYDSLQLAQQLVKYGLDDIATAVSEYEKLMLPRGKALISGSAANGELLFAENAPEKFSEIFNGMKADMQKDSGVLL
jgi:2-polyprenyl-6-methoxyphenol hydroxylase-like FAD-dependent oxidoreductase